MKRWALRRHFCPCSAAAVPWAAAGSGADDPDPEPTGTAPVQNDHDRHPGGPLQPRRLRGSEDWRLDRSVPAGRDRGVHHALQRESPARPIGLKVSTRLRRHYRVHAYRIGWYRGGTGHRVWISDAVQGRLQAEPRVSRRTRCAPWWRPGSATSRSTRPGGRLASTSSSCALDRAPQTQVPYVVSSPSARGTVALVAPITTWQAYNAWGGYSLYQGAPGDRRAWAVSFDRPYHLAPGANDFRSALLPVVVLAEKLGVPLSYYTNVDLDAPPRAAPRSARLPLDRPRRVLDPRHA